MKKLASFIAVIIVLLSGRLYAQSAQQINNLATFTKVWGFLKYYHPAVAKGNPDWDEEWLKTALTIKKMEHYEEFNQFIIKWYRDLPKYKLSGNLTQVYNDSLMRIFDEGDIRSFNIPAGMRKELVNLYRYHKPDSNKFVSNKYKQYTLDYVYHIENPYDKPAYPDEAHCLLALTRYWNIIQYFYPHKLNFASDWDKVLTDFIPQFINAKNATEYQSTFLKLTARIKDSHSFFQQKEWDAARNNFNLPFSVYYVDGNYVIGSSQYNQLMQQHDFKVGDEIVAINGKPIADRVNELAPFTTGTNNLSFYRNIGQQLFKIDTNRAIRLQLKRGDVVLNKCLNLYTEAALYKYRQAHPPKQWENLGHGIWYVRFCKITNVKQLKKMFTDIKDAKSVIWEMRDYPNFAMVQAVWPGLMAKRVVTGTNYNGELFYPGVFKAGSSQIESSPDTLGLPLFKGKLVVLVNEFTQSVAESVTSELRFRPNTVLIGRQTAGTTGNILFVEYPGGISASFTGVMVKNLNGSFTQGEGVKLDKKIKLTMKRMRSSADYELDEAYKEAL